MMSHGWPILVRGGLLDPRGWPPRYALMIASHRWLRFAAPFLHLLSLRSRLGAGGARPARRRRPAGPGRPAPAVPRRALLRPHAGVDRLRPLRLAAPRHGGRLGAGGGHAVTRRLFDVVVAGAALVVTSPVLLAAIVAIRLETPGHPIFRQLRIGKDGRPFDMLKLRTMVAGAESMGSGLAVNEGDARITRVGKILRRFSIDELPNLVNVLRGDMAIVGPRPTVQVQVAQYTERQRGRLAVKPGLTGWAQVNGRAQLSWAERIELDLWYIEHRSWRLDVRILLRTARIIIAGEGIYKGRTGGWR